MDMHKSHTHGKDAALPETPPSPMERQILDFHEDEVRRPASDTRTAGETRWSRPTPWLPSGKTGQVLSRVLTSGPGTGPVLMRGGGYYADALTVFSETQDDPDTHGEPHEVGTGEELMVLSAETVTPSSKQTASDTEPSKAPDTANGAGVDPEDGLSFLYEFTARTHAQLHRGSIVETAIDLLSGKAPAEFVTFLLKSKDRNVFRIQSRKALCETDKQRFQKAVKARLSIWVNGKPDTFVWSSSTPRPCARGSFSPAIFGESITIPIRVNGETVALLNLAGIQESAREDGWLDVIRAAAGNLSQALKNADLYERSRDLAETDELTGIKNYRGIMKRFELELERAGRYGRPLSVLMLDVDRFKSINDTHGHAAGDRVLQEIAGILTRSLRRSDSAGRYAGDEFVILLPETTQEKALGISKRICDRVRSHPWPSEWNELKVSVSIGVGFTQGPVERFSPDPLQAADAALYSAKKRGRDLVGTL